MKSSVHRIVADANQFLLAYLEEFKSPENLKW